MKGIRGILVAGLLGLAAAGTACGPTPDNGTVPPPPDGMVTLHVVNNSSQDIAYLYVSPTNSEAWGADVLGDENVIPAQTEFSVQVPAGVYDLKVEDYYHNEVGRRMGVSLTEESQWVLYPE